MARLFGTNGIRGVFGDGMGLRLVHDVALALAAHFGGGPVLVGHDGRASSVPMALAACSALRYAGADCGTAGLVPTPCLEYATRELGYRGGIMITASHNPPEYNGIKPAAPDGVEVSRGDELRIEDAYFRRAWRAGSPPWGAARPEGRAARAYLDGVASRVGAPAIRRAAPRVAIDAGNGAQSGVAARLCAELGCAAAEINGEVDPGFPGRGPEPTPDNLGALSEEVARSGADLGVAFDGDGDRSMLCDERGRVLTGDRSALLLARHVLARRPGSEVVTCLNSGSAIESVAAESGSRVVRTRVGSVEVSRRMVAGGSLVGFEENGGFMYGPHNAVRDGAMTLALALDALASSGRSLSELAAELPPSFTGKAKVPCGPEAARAALAAVAAENPGADTTDGVRVDLGGGRWFMVRASGTEPVVRIYAESDSQAGLEALLAGQRRRVESALAEQHI